jgi:hypothetical protein
MLVETHESIQAVDYRGVISDLRREWDSLWDQDYKATPFQTASWLLRWHEHLGNGEFLPLERQSASVRMAEPTMPKDSHRRFSLGSTLQVPANMSHTAKRAPPCCPRWMRRTSKRPWREASGSALFNKSPVQGPKEPG